MRSTKTLWLIICCLILITLTGCQESGQTSLELFPPQIGNFIRISGPSPDLDVGGDRAVYQSPEGTITLFVKNVGADNVEEALTELPATATDVGYSDALGPRQGKFFTFGQEYHAAWGNGDWVFVISADTEGARVSFLAYYGF